MSEFLQEYVNYHTLSAFFTALVLGGMVFFMFITTPAIFKSLEGDERSRYLKAIFPMYYRNLAGLSAIAGAFIFYRVESKWMWAMAATFLFCDFVLRPQINKYRDLKDKGDEAGTKKFKAFHRLSVLINIIQLVIIIGIFFRLAV